MHYMTEEEKLRGDHTLQADCHGEVGTLLF